MTSNRAPWWAYASVLVAACFSLYALSFRFRSEQSNRAVEIVAEYDQIDALAAASGTSAGDALLELARAGLTGVVLSEETLGAMEDRGEAALRVHGEFGAGSGRSGGSALVVCPSRDALQRVARGIRILYPRATWAPRTIGSGGFAAVVDSVSGELLRAVPVGLNPRAVVEAKGSGLDIVARLSNQAAGATYVASSLEWARELGARVFLPMGEQVLGRRENLDALVEALRQGRMLYASPEFAKIGGDANVIALAPDIVVRLHSAQAAELDKMSLSAAVERYSRAAAERNIRILLLRPMSLSAASPLREFGLLADGLTRQLRIEGLESKLARAFDDPAAPAWIRPAIGLAAAPAMIYVATLVLPALWMQLLAAVLAIAIGAGAATDAGRTYAALACAFSFPVAGFLLLGSWRSLPVLLKYVLVSMVSLAGGLCVAGLMTGVPTMIRAEQFEGVKLAHFGPVLVVAAWFFWELGGGRQALRTPVNWMQALIGFAVLAGVGLMILRTGNDNPAAVSGLELQLRSLLEQLLFVRPRTKELALGHPMLIVGLCLLARHGPRPASLGGWTTFALALGAIGQTSIVNTMCHLHTPLQVSFVRIGVGLVLGGIIGGLLWAGVGRLAPKKEG